MKIQIPTTCPCCDYPLVKVNDQLFCRNTACSAQLNKKIEHFAKTLGIKGFGEKTIQKLNLSDLTELFYLDREEVVSALGSEKVSDKLLDEIRRSKVSPLATVLASFSIPLIGNSASTKIASVVNRIEDITPELCKQAGLGDKATANLMGWIEYEYQELKDFLPFDFSTPSSKPVENTGKTVCITGKLKSFKTKAEAYISLQAAGYTPVESVTKATQFLVDEEDKNSSKRKKADEYGITIISNLFDYLNT